MLFQSMKNIMFLDEVPFEISNCKLKLMQVESVYKVLRNETNNFISFKFYKGIDN